MDHSTISVVKVTKLATAKSSEHTQISVSHPHDLNAPAQSDHGLHGSGKINFGSHGIDAGGSVSYSGVHGNFNANFDYSYHSDFNIGGSIKF